MMMDIEKLAYDHGANIYENGEVRFYTLNAFNKFAEAYHQAKCNEEILTIRAKVASAEVLVEALRTVMNEAEEIVLHDTNFVAVPFEIFYKMEDEYEALATYDKLSEVKE